MDAILTAARTDTRFGRCNYAMTIFLARLGPRAPEVIAIQLDDMDWHEGHWSGNPTDLRSL